MFSWCVKHCQTIMHFSNDERGKSGVMECVKESTKWNGSGVLHQGERKRNDIVWKMSQSPINAKEEQMRWRTRFPTQGHTCLFSYSQLQAEDNS